VPRSRSASTEQAILLAVLQLLPQVGYDRLSLDVVAHHARSSKATIYRHWASKADLVRDAIAQRLPAAAVPPKPTGSLSGDLVALMRQVVVSAQDAYELVVGLPPVVGLHEEVVGAVRERAAETCRTHLRAVLDRDGVGQITPEQCARLTTLLGALVWDRMFTPHAALDDAFVVQTVDTVLIPLLRAWSLEPAAPAG
jgi:AcrR family transcriptional regulator